MLGKLMTMFRAWKRLGIIGNKVYWPNARMVFADIPVDAQVVKEWLPFPLFLPRPATARVFMADYRQTVFGEPYMEVGLMIKCRLFGIIPVLHCPWMLVDDDRHLIQGRELLGYPKKMAKIRFEEKDGKFFGSAERRGKEVFRMEGRIGEPVRNPSAGPGQWWVNVRSFMGFMPGHLTMFRPLETVHSANAMELKVTISPNDNDPICSAIGPATDCTIRTCDMSGSLWLPPLRIFPVGPAFLARLMHLRAA